MKESLLFSSLMTLTLIFSSTSFAKAEIKKEPVVIKPQVEKQESKPTISFEKGMNEAAKIYLPMQEELANNSFKSFAKLADQLEELAERFDMSDVKEEHSKHYEGIPEKIISQSKSLKKSKSIKEARESFKLLSQAFAMWVSMDKPKHLQVVYCPMAKASWIQSAGTEVSNPYLTNMPRCGSIVGASKKEKHKH